MVQNQILRAPIVLLERSIGGRKHGHVAIREGSIGHLTRLQKLIKLKQKSRMWFYGLFDHLLANRCHQLTGAWYEKKRENAHGIIVCVSRTLNKIKQSLAALKRAGL